MREAAACIVRRSAQRRACDESMSVTSHPARHRAARISPPSRPPPRASRRTCRRRRCARRIRSMRSPAPSFSSSARTCSASARSSSAAQATRCGRCPTTSPGAASSRIRRAITARRSRSRRKRAASRRTSSCPKARSRSKVAAIERYGATLHRCAPTMAARDAAVARLLAETGGTLVHPYTTPAVIAGAGHGRARADRRSRPARCAGHADRRRRPHRRQRDRGARAACPACAHLRGGTRGRGRRVRIAAPRRARARARAGHDLRRPARDHRRRSTSSC